MVKKLLLSISVILLLSVSSGVASANAALPNASVQSLSYEQWLHPGQTYQMGYGKGYTYYFHAYNNSLSLSSTGLVTALISGGGGYVMVYDRFGSLIEEGQFFVY
ncbi:hypothetical protein [Paenibacillus glacialis]|uniref:Uncharacterized protein n=1 Tax=Paenibacillus glacialis TaxID=494026 RepID=A0A168D4B5_9BACL|nr:hypothetical protein [Paenibacillus glacialis]OAB33857.1 hypothetical protein PGLA_23320 [Paenibacillus glacialis]